MKTLTVVATPIGNLNDITPRMKQALESADLLLAESISATQRLCSHLGIQTPPIKRYWSKTEKTVHTYLEKSHEAHIVLISDAGTPCISDPGYQIVKLFHEKGWLVKTVVGPCAAIAALSISGLPSDQFTFYGFLSAKREARKSFLNNLSKGSSTWIAFESPRRILDLTKDVCDLLGDDYIIAIVKEISKIHETVYRGTAESVLQQLSQSTLKGEYVLIGAPIQNKPDWAPCATALNKRLGINEAASITANIYKISKNTTYNYLKENS